MQVQTFASPLIARKVVAQSSFHFAIEFRNPARMLPQLDVTTVDQLLGALFGRIVVNAVEVDSFNVMGGSCDKVRSIV
jgi:hypothetical protein